MKQVHVPLLGFLLLFFLPLSCRKTDRPAPATGSPAEQRFFTEHRTADPAEAALVAFIKRSNDNKPFVEKTVRRIGYPRWDKAIRRLEKPGPGKGGRGNARSNYDSPNNFF